MPLAPHSAADLAALLAEHSRDRSPVTQVDLTHLSSLIEHRAEDMTVSVQAGITLHALQRQLRCHSQWLPVDPPGSGALNISDLLAFDRSGPRRFGCGTIRDSLIGIKVALASGEIVKAGGNVVKNVAGYDLCKLFIGARHTLGIIVEAVFKLKPIPEAERILESTHDSVVALDRAARALLSSPAEPVILDAHNLDRLTLIVGFAGTSEDVAYQTAIAARLADWQPGSTVYDETVLPGRISVLPSKIGAAAAELGTARFVARWGNGVLYHDSPPSPGRPAPLRNRNLMDRVKRAYDPAGIFATL